MLAGMVRVSFPEVSSFFRLVAIVGSFLTIPARKPGQWRGFPPVHVSTSVADQAAADDPCFPSLPRLVPHRPPFGSMLSVHSVPL